MQAGYLYIETSASHPGLIRIVESEESPDTRQPANADPLICYVARFDDKQAAMMHIHELLRHQLIDPDFHLYRTNPLTAVAGIEADILRHKRIFLLPETEGLSISNLQVMANRHRMQQLKVDKIWRLVGFLALVLLLFNLLLGA